MTEFLQSSLDFTANTPLENRKKRGQYMTPRTISSILLDMVPLKAGDRVLDPAVGTGELLYTASERVPDATYEGWDIDDVILSYTEERDNITFTQKDCLSIDAKPEYDVILANPPYFEFKLDKEQKAKFASVIGGRVNIFSLFFYQALNLLKEDGYMGFIVPPSMNNGAYFKNLRRYLLANAELVGLRVINKSDHFIDAQTSAQIIVFKKTSTPTKEQSFVFTSTDKATGIDNPVFTTNVDFLKNEWKGKSSIWDLGYTVSTGAVAWNFFKGQFVDEENGVPLVYSKDIKTNGTISYHAPLSVRRYLPATIPGLISTPAIVVNRITGAVGSGTIRAAIVDKGQFYGENHVNVITPRTNVPQQVDLKTLLDRISKANPMYLALLTGNTQISAKELAHHIPF